MENTNAYLMMERQQQSDDLRHGGLSGMPLPSEQAAHTWAPMPASTPVTNNGNGIPMDHHQQHYRQKPAPIVTPSTTIPQQHSSFQLSPVSPCVNGTMNMNSHAISSTGIHNGVTSLPTTTPTPSSSSSSSSSSFSSSSSSGYSPLSTRRWPTTPTSSSYSPYHQQQQQEHRQEQPYYDQQPLPVTAGHYQSPSPFMQSPIVSTTRSHSVKRNKLRQATYTRWSLEEDERLKQAVAMHGPHKWSLIASHVPNRTPMQCSTRWLGALNPNIHKGRWTDYEDNILKYSVLEYANVTDNQGRIQPIPWNRIADRIPHRTGIQCQARWTEALDPYVRKGKWGADEDHLLRSGVQDHGRCWIRIAETIPGRTQRQCRTRWMQLQCKYSKQQQQQQPSNRSTAISSSGHQQMAAMPDQIPYESPGSSIDEAISPSSTEDDPLGMTATGSSPTKMPCSNYANYSHHKMITNQRDPNYLTTNHELNNAMLQQQSYHLHQSLESGTQPQQSSMNYHPRQPVKPIFHQGPASDVYSYFNQISQPFSSQLQHQ